MRRVDVEVAPEVAGVDVLAVPLREGAGPDAGPALRKADAWSEGAVSRLLARRAFRGKEGESRLLPQGAAGRPDLLLVGLGKEPGAEALRRAAGVAIRAARGDRAGSVGFVVPGDGGEEELWQAAAEGLVLGDWTYDELRSREEREERPPPPERAVLLPEDGVHPAPRPAQMWVEAASRGRMVAEAQNEARGLVARPANIVTPSHLAAVAEEMAERYGLRVQCWGTEKLRAEGFGALLAVSRGSAEEPRFVILEHRGEGGDPYCLVGKGVTFDSGGISLKPASGMEAMKYDMAGAAAVLGALRASAQLGVEKRVIGLIPATENLPSGTALKPGDVIRGVSGKSIEVVNTDAEGRLVLSDALSFASRLKPRAVVDLATLTGGCVVALGRQAIGLMTPEDDLAAELEEAGRRTGERVWRLPLWREYRKQLESEIADLKNSGGREASPITAGYFLKEFVGEARWAHLDIAGTAWADEERFHQPKGATGVGVRLLVDWLRRAS